MAAKVAGKLTINVLKMKGGPEYIGVFKQDKMDPYFTVSLHDGKFEQGGAHVGESIKTTVKVDAGTSAEWDETEVYIVNKPEHMDIIRVKLWDSDVVYDDSFGCIDCDLNILFEGPKYGESVSKTLQILKDGKEIAEVDIKVKLDV